MLLEPLIPVCRRPGALWITLSRCLTHWEIQGVFVTSDSKPMVRHSPLYRRGLDIVFLGMTYTVGHYGDTCPSGIAASRC